MAKKSRAEIQRQYRERRNADQARQEQYLKKEQDKYRRDLKDGKRKLVSDMSARQLRKTRKEWTKRQRISRASKISEQMDSVSEFSLPSTASCSSTPISSVSRQKAYGQKMKTREKNKAYRRIRQLEEELAKAKRRADKHKKRSQRNSTTWTANTPRIRTRKLIANFNKNKKEGKKVLVFHYALVDQIRRRYLDSNLEREKQTFTRLVTGKLMRQYRLQRMTNQSLGFSVKRWKCVDSQQLRRR